MDRAKLHAGFGRAIALMAAFSVETAGATSLSGVPVQVNKPPATGFYEISTSQIVDMGPAAVGIVWKEDRVGDPGRLEGESILLRVFGTTKATPFQVKPTVRLDVPSEDGFKSLMGGRRRADGTVDVFWTIGTLSTSRFRLFQQPFVSQVKSGSALTLFSDALGAFRLPRLVNLLSGRSLILWNTVGETTGRFLPPTGPLGAAFKFVTPTGESLLQTAPITGGLAATTAKYGASFKSLEVFGHSYDTDGKLEAPKTLLIPTKPVGTIVTTTLVRRSDDSVAYIYALKSANGKIDVFGRAYSATWAPLTGTVKIVSGLPIGGRGPVATSLPDAELLIAQEKPSGGAKVIEYGRLDRNLLPTGTTARLGPFPVLNGGTMTLLSGGKAVAVFDKGTTARYIQFINP